MASCNSPYFVYLTKIIFIVLSSNRIKHEFKNSLQFGIHFHYSSSFSLDFDMHTKRLKLGLFFKTFLILFFNKTMQTQLSQNLEKSHLNANQTQFN